VRFKSPNHDLTGGVGTSTAFKDVDLYPNEPTSRCVRNHIEFRMKHDLGGTATAGKVTRNEARPFEPC